MSDLKVTTATNGEAAAAKSSSADIAKGHLLMLVLDINPNQLLFARRPKLLLKWLDAALAVANSHLMLHPNNAVAAVAAHSQGCTFLYPGPSEATATGDSAAAGPSILRQRDGQFEAFYRVESAIRKEVTRILVAETDQRAPVNADSLLSGALCMALAFINRQRGASSEEITAGDSSLSSSMLVMSASGDTTSQYMNYMNVFFSAQKMNVHIDSCMVDKDSSLLQQGADITGGIYRKIDSEKHFDSLLQFLIWLFLPDPALRKSLSLPAAEKVDYRAACFCHRELVDVGFVCSVCLSVFCKFSPICSTCDAMFKPPGALPLSAVKKKKPKGPSGPGSPNVMAASIR